jgi:hypothetical protein
VGSPWTEPAIDVTFDDVTPVLRERLDALSRAHAAGRLPKHRLYEQVHALWVVERVVAEADPNGFDLDAPPGPAERRFGMALAQAMHEGLSLDDIGAVAGTDRERLIAVGKRTIRRTGWLKHV